MKSVEKIWKQKHEFFFVFAVCSTKAHGKHNLCRVPRARHTAKVYVLPCASVDTRRIGTGVTSVRVLTAAGEFAVCQPTGTRQTITAVRPPAGRRVCPARDPCSPCAYWLTHGEDQGLPCAGPWHTAKSKVSRVFFLCRVFFWRHTAKEVFVVCPK